MSAWLNLFVGIVSGIITYVLIEAFVRFMKKVAIPWYQKIKYEGHHIKGEWLGYNATVMDNGEYQPDSEDESTIKIEQEGNKIVGELLLTTQPNGDKCRKIFQLEGKFVDMVLVLTVKATDHNTMGAGTLIMRLAENGQRLKGKHAYISSHDWLTITSRDQVWIRKTTTEHNG